MCGMHSDYLSDNCLTISNVHVAHCQTQANARLAVCWLLQPVCGCFTVQKLDLSAEVKKNYPRYNLYFYGEGSVDIFTHVSLCHTVFI